MYKHKLRQADLVENTDPVVNTKDSWSGETDQGAVDTNEESSVSSYSNLANVDKLIENCNRSYPHDIDDSGREELEYERYEKSLLFFSTVNFLLLYGTNILRPIFLSSSFYYKVFSFILFYFKSETCLAYIS